jgi:ubiquinone biosynthesis protein
MNPFPMIGRAVRVLFLVTLFVPAYLLRRLWDRRAGPVLLRQFFQSCGGCFVKAGQVLATRYDLIPAEYCQELSRLFDRMPSVSMAVVREVVESDLKRPLEGVFREFNPIALASASIAQVHDAVLHTGEPVVVKVMRPGIKQPFLVDLAFIKRLARFSRRHRMILRIDLTALAQDFINLTQEELDFRREARNTDRMRRLMQDDAVDHCAPRVFFEFSGSHIITMERMVGVAVIDLMAAVERRDLSQLELWSKRGITPEGTAELLLRSVLEQTMHHRVFQADPHPGNLIMLDGGILAWVDFGMLGWLDERTWLQQFRMRWDVAFGRIHAAYERLLEMLQPLPPADLSGFEQKVKTVIQDWIESSASPNASYQEKSSGYFFVRLFMAIRGSGLSLPANVLRLYRTVIVADSIMLRLDPEIDWIRILRRFMEIETERQLALSLRETFSAESISHMLAVALHIPPAMIKLIDWLNCRLPQVGWNYQQRMSLFERGLLAAVGLLRFVMFLFTLTILGERAGRLLYPASSWFGLDRLIGGYWWLLVAIGVLAVLTLSRLLAAMELA